MKIRIANKICKSIDEDIPTKLNYTEDQLRRASDRHDRTKSAKEAAIWLQHYLAVDNKEERAAYYTRIGKPAIALNILLGNKEQTIEAMKMYWQKEDGK